MIPILNQLGGDTSVLGTVIWFVLFFVLMFLYPKLMLSQLIFRIEQSATKMEGMSQTSIKMVTRKLGKPNKELKQKIEDFTDFFVVEPSNIDPYGLVRKIDRTIIGMEERFTEFTEEIAGGKSEAEKQEINYALRAAIGLRQISKVVRHYVEIAKKFKNLQIAMILQMQLPIIEKVAEGELQGTEAFINNWPIGDSIGPLVAASLINESKEVAEDIMMGTADIEGRKCFVLKAKAGPHLGRVDYALQKIMKGNKISRVITIDAGQKLEGEKSGSVSEGTGFAMGGWAQREMIENMLLDRKIPIDGIVVKVGMVEAIQPLRKEIFESLPRAQENVRRAVRRAKKGGKVIIIGVGNSSGVGDNKKTVDDVKKAVDELDKKYKKQEKEQKKRRWV